MIAILCRSNDNLITNNKFVDIFWARLSIYGGNNTILNNTFVDAGILANYNVPPVAENL